MSQRDTRAGNEGAGRELRKQLAKSGQVITQEQATDHVRKARERVRKKKESQ